ncbi:hypothetical protein ID47_07080 [Candidatus Paracaedibacter acanthamoebae]|uniref:Uncharacterized protein n=2 Tax=Candidatus Odyssella acanthamoebae TaxID=91604 RepID=A0A077B0U1_9PROT|nr:hypothetical protein ID47_07080 [Candidatus Paracaedibacter acanthamoebae]
MQIENNYDKEIYNGDVGFIQSINYKKREIGIKGEEKEVTYDFKELYEIGLSMLKLLKKSTHTINRV